jgi:type IV pilus assembly protein PilB
MAVFHDEEQNKKLAEIHARQEESAVKALSDDYGIGYIDLSGIGINTDGLLLIPESVSRDAGIAVFAMVGKKINVAVISPTAPSTIEQIDNLETKGFTVQLYLASHRSLEKAWARYADVSGALRARGGLLDISDEELQKLAGIVHSNADIRDQFLAMVHSTETHKVSKLMEIIFGTAIGTKSSDVHIEAAEQNARLRFRQDGVLQDIVDFPLDVYKSINSRIKLLSEMKLTSTETAQDGRFTIMYKGIEIEIRTSLIPGPYGESIVMRILNPEGLTVELEKMGIQKKLFDILNTEIEKPNGMFITTGPTGSGKTTTLYSYLKRIYSPEIKILTIEDPIEYHLPGITQTQVDHEKGYDFSSGLRAALRQDPDVIMVGEIRDAETASTAINASLTGHMVLSTLHTNNAAGAIPRLIELKVNPKILPDALTVTMAQRLIRRLCVHCKAVYTPSPDDEKLLRAIVKNAESVGKDFASLGITSTGSFTMYKAVGCDQCDNIGYKGRIGLYEAILIDDKVAEIIANNPTEREIKHGSLHQGIFTMVEDGVSKILSGVTTIDEVRSTVDMAEDLPEGWHTGVITSSSNSPSPIVAEPIPTSITSTLQASPAVPQVVYIQPSVAPVPDLSHYATHDELHHLEELVSALPDKIQTQQKSSLRELFPNQESTEPVSGIQNIPIPERKPILVIRPQQPAAPAPIPAAEKQSQVPDLASVMNERLATNLSSTDSDLDDWQEIATDFAILPDTNPVSMDHQLPAKELEVLVDYLKMLEREQVRDPETGIRVKIAEVKEMIIELMRRYHISEWIVPNRRVVVHDEVKQIMKDLESLEQHQSRRPNIGVANQLRDIRNTIEKLLGKE